MSMYDRESEDNLVKWQLDLKEEMDRIYHLLKGHIMREDENGNRYYVEPEDDNLKPFNEFGTQLILNILSFYLNRNTILSNYSDEMIEDKVYDFGIELTALIYSRYEEMMMTTSFEKEYKKLYKKDYVAKDASNKEITAINNILRRHLEGKQKLFMITIRELVDTIHSSYLRALNGGERRELRTARTVTQNDNGNMRMNYPSVTSTSGQQKKWYNPTRYI